MYYCILHGHVYDCGHHSLYFHRLSMKNVGGCSAAKQNTDSPSRGRKESREVTGQQGREGYLSHFVGKPTMWFPNRSDTNRPVQVQKRARSLKFWSYVEEELYYPSSENKGADKLCGYREADLGLCFRICRLLVFP